MLKRWFVILMFCCAVLPAGEALARSGRETALDSLVQVIVETRFGTTRRASGYLFSASGQVATAFHTISDATRITVFSPSRGVFEVKHIKRIDPRTNIAILQADGMIPDFSVARLGDHRSLRVGDPVHVLHHPFQLDTSLYSGTISELGYPSQLTQGEFTSSYASEFMLIGVVGPFDAGSAGGLLLDSHFNVIGLMLGGGETTAEGRMGYACVSSFLNPYTLGGYDQEWSTLRSDVDSDAGYFDTFFGPAQQIMDYTAPMTEGYAAWFSPIKPVAYHDDEFTQEINDMIAKDWFHSAELRIDGRRLAEYSASRIFIWPAEVNPWELENGDNEFVYFDADSLFSKRVYTDRVTEERIMTRYLIAVPLAVGSHVFSYENLGANFNTSGLKTKRFEIKSGDIRLLDIDGLSLVKLKLLDTVVAGVGEGEPVRYELERRPIGFKELIFGLRSIRLDVEPLER